jgi:cyclopropane-fatty-acyl-phospholipid synthase
MTPAPSDRRVATARTLLERVFASAEVPLTFRLWDGTTVCVGARGESPFAVVFRSPPAFRRVLRRPTPLGFGEAYIGGDIDIEGDLFAAMDAANAIERLRVPLATWVAALVRSLRV